jgi:Uma2 family endonuclease
LSPAPDIRFLTPRQYLLEERAAQCKSEYYRGQVVAMSGASREHNLIVGNLVTAANIAFRGRPCEVYPSDMRVKIRSTGLYAYPDVTIACGDRRFEDSFVDTLLNPTVLFEVLSPSTEQYDRGFKAVQYRQLASLRELVLIASQRPFVEHYARQPDGSWRLEEQSELTQPLTLPSCGVTLTLADIYQRVEFPPVEPLPEDEPPDATAP